jgi:transcriptional regulator NrdR family protein
MVATKMQLKVVKTDGCTEEYLHTKVIGTISRALAQVGQADTCIAEHLAEVVTYFLYHKNPAGPVTSSEVFSVIKAVLTATGFEDAAIALSEHHFKRKIKRSRIEVVSIDIQELGDAEMLCRPEEEHQRARWDKSRIVADLVTKHRLSRQTARTIASMVEEKIFNMGITLVPASLIKQLVLSDTAAVLRAHRQLQTI